MRCEFTAETPGGTFSVAVRVIGGEPDMSAMIESAERVLVAVSTAHRDAALSALKRNCDELIAGQAADRAAMEEQWAHARARWMALADRVEEISARLALMGKD